MFEQPSVELQSNVDQLDHQATKAGPSHRHMKVLSLDALNQVPNPKTCLGFELYVFITKHCVILKMLAIVQGQV